MREDGSGYVIRRRANRLGSEVGVARRRLDLSVAQQSSDHRQPLTRRHRCRGEGVAQVVDANVLQPGPRPHAPPEGLEIAQSLPVQRAGDDPRVAVNALCLCQEVDDRLADMNQLRSGLRVRQAQGPPAKSM